MKSKEARDAIISVIDNQLQGGLKPTKQVYKWGRSKKELFDSLSGMLQKGLSLSEQNYLNERKEKNL